MVKTYGLTHIAFGISPGRSERYRCRNRPVTKAGRKILNKGEFCPGKFYLFFKDLNDYELEIAFELATPVDPRSAK